MIVLEKYIAGNFEKSFTGYQYFVPTPINTDWKWDNNQINQLVERAAIKLGELNSYATLVPNIDLFIQLHVTKEAVISSRIEGTQTQIDEAFLKKEEVAPERRNDWQEVKNYIKALNYGIETLETLPISSRLLRQVHEILLDSVRGEHKQPGVFRSSQNWIGGSSLADAAFVPPHQNYLDQLMGDLENFLHNTEINIPTLIKIGIAHYQFETIHPFLDGNGRIGRLLITLFLVEQKMLSKPLLYLSAYFEQNKSLYYDNLTFVRTKNDMAQWLKYFLVGVAQTAANASNTLAEVLKIKTGLEEQIPILFGRKSHKATVLLNHLFVKPVIHVNEAVEVTGLSFKAAGGLIEDFLNQGILKEITGKQRNRLFVFEAYIKLF